MDIIRSCKVSTLGCAVFAVFLLFPPKHPARAEGEENGTSEGREKKVDQYTTATTTTRDLGTGKFWRFPFHISVSLRGGYDDNVLTSSFDRQGSAFTNANIALSYNFGSPRTQISLKTNAGISYYFDRPGEDYDLSPNLAFSLSHKASPRLTLSVVAYATYQSQPDFSITASLNRRSGNFFYTQDKFAAAYQWVPRFSTVTSYTLGIIKYDNSATGLFEDRFEHTLGNEFRFLIWPTTTLVGEYRFQIIDYDSFPRNSTTHFVLGGFDHSFNPRFNVSVRAGTEFRSSENFGNEINPYAEGTLTYALGPHTSITWTNRYGLEEPDVPGSASRTTFRTALQARYNITARIVTNLGFFYQHDQNSAQNSAQFLPGIISPAFAEDTFGLLLSARFQINRIYAVEAGYNFADVRSDILLREYYRNQFYAGLNFSF
jgi:hypothetical protein